MSQVSWGQKPTHKKPADTNHIDKLVSGSGGGKSRLNAQIPEDLHARFKSKVSLQKKEMTPVLIELLEEYCSRP